MSMIPNDNELVQEFGPVAIVTTAAGDVTGDAKLGGYTHWRSSVAVDYNFNGTGTTATVPAGQVTALTPGMTFQGIYVIELM